MQQDLKQKEGFGVAGGNNNSTHTRLPLPDCRLPSTAACGMLRHWALAGAATAHCGSYKINRVLVKPSSGGAR